MMPDAPFSGSYWVQPGLIAGHYPSEVRSEISALLTSGVTLFLDLTEADELPSYAPALPQGIEHRRLPIPDFSIPTPAQMERILQTLELALTKGRRVYLHCRGGLGRTGTVVGCHLAGGGMTGREALLEIRRLRGDCGPDSPETEPQRAMVRQWPCRQKSSQRSEGLPVRPRAR